MTNTNIAEGAPNPKDLIGAKKVDLSLLPVIAIAHGAHAFMDGAKKYGPYNWRDYAVEARTYVAAAKRHLDAWLEREEFAKDSGVHHLGHVIACCAILLDAQAHQMMIDNRPKENGGWGNIYSKALEDLNTKIKKAAEEQSLPVPEPKKKKKVEPDSNKLKEEGLTINDK